MVGAPLVTDDDDNRLLTCADCNAEVLWDPCSDEGGRWTLGGACKCRLIKVRIIESIAVKEAA